MCVCVILSQQGVSHHHQFSHTPLFLLQSIAPVTPQPPLLRGGLLYLRDMNFSLKTYTCWHTVCTLLCSSAWPYCQWELTCCHVCTVHPPSVYISWQPARWLNRYYITDCIASLFSSRDKTQSSTCPFREWRLIRWKQTDKKFLLWKISLPETLESLSGPWRRSGVSDITSKKSSTRSEWRKDLFTGQLSQAFI